jgi:hypothetical protein
MSKQKPSLQNGSQKHHPGSKSIASLVKCEADVDSFFNAKVSFTMHFYPMARLSRNSTVSKRQWEEKGPIHGGEKNGCSTMTALLHIHYLFVTFSQSTRPHSFHKLPACQTLHQQTTFCSWRCNIHWRSMFWVCWEHPKKFTDGAACSSTKSIPAMFPKL